MSCSDSLGDRKEIRLSQGTISYRERGAGPPIVFVHGLLVNGDLWSKVVPPLATHFRCITPDWPLGSHTVPMPPGADLSPPGLARLIAEFLAAMNLDDVTLVANDTGGALTQIVATKHPQRVGRVVLTNCDAYDIFPPAVFRYLLWSARVPGALFLLMQPMRWRALRRLPIAFGWLAKRPFDAAVSDSFADPVLSNRAVRDDVIKVLKGISPQHTLAAAEKLKDFHKPVLLAWAPEDRLFPVEYARRLAAALPDARLELIADSYTFIPLDQPTALAEQIQDLIRRPAHAAPG